MLIENHPINFVRPSIANFDLISKKDFLHIKDMFKTFVVGISFVVCYTYFSLSFLNPVISRSGYWFLFLRVNLILFTHLITILRSVRGQCGIYSVKSSLISDSNFDKFANSITSIFFEKKLTCNTVPDFRKKILD